MKICLDFDGVIKANWQHYYQLSLDFGLSGHDVYILTAAKYSRQKTVERLLERSNIWYDKIIFRPKEFISTYKNIGEWKKDVLKKYDIDLWFDNEVKIYEEAGVDFSDLKTAIVRI